MENFVRLKEHKVDFNLKENKKEISCLLLHSCDLGHAGKITEITEKNARLVNKEFSAQYELEIKNKIPLTPYFKDLHLGKVFYKGEMNFLKFIILPLFKATQEFLDGKI